MNQSKISVRYAKAFFELSLEKNKLQAVVTEVTMVFNSLNTIPELLNFVQNPIIKPSQKQIGLKKIFENKVSDDIIKFFNLIVENKREAYLPDILRNFLDMYRKHSGITQVTLTTAQSFTKEQTDSVTKYIESKYNTKVELKETVNPEIMGGFVLRIDDVQYDASIKTRLKNIKKELLS